MKGKLLVLIAIVVLFSTSIVHAHHSFASTYFEDQTVKIEGELVAFLFRNPHSFVHVMAPDENGEMVRWGVEWGGAGQLGSQGITRGSLRVGDHVVIMGNPGREAEDHRIRMRSVLRPEDGFGWGQQGEDFD